MPKRDIFAEARRRVPLEKHPAAKPAPGDTLPLPPPSTDAATAAFRVAHVAAGGIAGGPIPGTYAASLSRCFKAAEQLHAHKGYYYRKWRAAMRKRFGRPSKRGG